MGGGGTTVIILTYSDSKIRLSSLQMFRLYVNSGYRLHTVCMYTLVTVCILSVCTLWLLSVHSGYCLLYTVCMYTLVTVCIYGVFLLHSGHNVALSGSIQDFHTIPLQCVTQNSAQGTSYSFTITQIPSCTHFPTSLTEIAVQTSKVCDWEERDFK
jgi:hypothetical protein